MYRFSRMVQRDLLNLVVNPMWILFGLLFPFLLVAILGFTTKGLYSDTFTSYDYYGVTLLLFSSFYAATFAANSFMEERIKKANLRSIYTPIRQGEIPLSKTTASFLFCLLFYSLSGVAVKVLFKTDFGGSSLFYVWLLFAALILVSSSVGVLMCCLFKSESVANQILSIVIIVVAIPSGLLFPTTSFGKTFERVSSYVPSKKLTQTIFELIYDQNTQHFLPVFVTLLVLSAVLICLSYCLFRGEDYI